MAAFAAAFNARDTKALCSRIPGDDALSFSEYGRPSWSNFSFTRHGERGWKTCTTMYATGWATCPDFKIAAADAELDTENALDWAFALGWGSESHYRGVGAILTQPDTESDPPWVWTGQEFYCAG